MNFAADNAAFLADFGLDATLNNAPVRIIFDSAYLASLDVESSNPVALLPDGDAVGVRQGAVLTVLGATYQVVAVQPDGTGFTMLELVKA